MLKVASPQTTSALRSWGCLRSRFLLTMSEAVYVVRGISWAWERGVVGCGDGGNPSQNRESSCVYMCLRKGLVKCEFYSNNFTVDYNQQGKPSYTPHSNLAPFTKATVCKCPSITWPLPTMTLPHCILTDHYSPERKRLCCKSNFTANLVSSASVQMRYSNCERCIINQIKLNDKNWCITCQLLNAFNLELILVKGGIVL